MRNPITALRALLRSLVLSFTIAAVMARDAIGAGVVKVAGIAETMRAPHFRYDVECVGPDGAVKWRETFFNPVTTAGKNDLLTNYFKGSAYTAAFYVGLIDNAGFTAVAATDTAAAHAGWTESSVYTAGTRPALTLGTASAGSIDNSASKASYAINGAATINGAFVITNSTKGGTTGVLYSAASFGATRTVANSDTLNVQVTLSV